MSQPSFARPVRIEDHDAIDALLTDAFKGPAEAQLVHELRNTGDLYKEIVMPYEDGVAGYLALTRLLAPDHWFALGPVAIHPDWQGKGRGKFMVLTEVEELVHRAGKTLVVLGPSGFYRSAGFSRVRARRLRTPYPKANMHIAAPGADVPQFDIVYAQPFHKL